MNIETVLDVYQSRQVHDSTTLEKFAEERCHICRHRLNRWKHDQKCRHLKSVSHIAEVYGVNPFKLREAVNGYNLLHGNYVAKKRHKKQKRSFNKLTVSEQINSAQLAVNRWTKKMAQAQKKLRLWSRRLNRLNKVAEEQQKAVMQTVNQLVELTEQK